MPNGHGLLPRDADLGVCVSDQSAAGCDQSSSLRVAAQRFDEVVDLPGPGRGQPIPLTKKTKLGSRQSSYLNETLILAR